MMSIASITHRLADWRRRSLDFGRGLGDWCADEQENYCVRCGASVGPGGVTGAGCAFCVDNKMPWHRITRLGVYNPPLDEAIKAMKFGRDWARGGWFGRRLAEVLDEPMDKDKTIVCWVPMHRLRQWGRGYNQSQLIAEALAEARGLTLLPLLHRVRHTRPQTTLTGTERLSNVNNAFTARPIDLRGYDVLLVDDVKTTGSTLRACCKPLQEKGARTIHAAVVAVADPAHRDFKVTP